MDSDRSRKPPLESGDIILKVGQEPVTPYNVGAALRKGPVGSRVEVTYKRGANIVGASWSEGCAYLLRQDRRIIDGLVAVEEALDDWRNAAHVLGGEAGRVANIKLDALGMHVAILGSAIAVLEAELSASNHALTSHVQALEQQLLVLAKGQVVQLDPAPSDAGPRSPSSSRPLEASTQQCTEGREDVSDVLLIGAEVEGIKGKDALRRQVEELSREAALNAEYDKHVDELRLEVTRLRKRELADAVKDMCARRHILGGTGANETNAALQEKVRIRG